MKETAVAEAAQIPLLQAVAGYLESQATQVRQTAQQELSRFVRWCGADTAIIVRPVNSQDFFDLKVREILCKPRSW